MRILVDTHIFLWMLASPEKFSETRRYELESSTNELYLSAISIAELMIKHSIRKLKVNFDPMEAAEKIGLEILGFSGEEAMVLKDLPFHHKDPFDRMLIAQSLTNKLILMSDDSKFLLYDCKTI